MRCLPLVLLVLLALANCAPSGVPGHAERGIGGTGAPGSLAERGIGGTGVQTGIVGTITGFGSVRVNGLEIASEGLADVEIDGVRRPVGALRIGQLARVVALTDDGGLRAQAIEVDHEVTGPVQRIQPNGVLIVAGQRVRITPQTLGDVPQVGNWVEVSGLRNGFGAILASRIDQRAPVGDVTVSGRLTRFGQGWRIGTLLVRPPEGADLSERRVKVTGVLVGHIIAARTLTSAPLIRFRPRLARLIVQAFVQARDGRLQLGEGVEAVAGGPFGPLASEAPVVLDIVSSADGTLTATGVHESGEHRSGDGSTGSGAPAGGGPSAGHGGSAGSSTGGAASGGAASGTAHGSAAITGAVTPGTAPSASAGAAAHSEAAHGGGASATGGAAAAGGAASGGGGGKK